MSDQNKRNLNMTPEQIKEAYRQHGAKYGPLKKGVKEKKSKWKVVTSRLNGKKGGRPKKK